MKEICLNTASKSQVFIESGILDGTAYADFVKPAASIFLVTDANVASLYLDKASKWLKSSDCRLESCVLRPGEAEKSFENLLSLFEHFHEANLDRHSLIAALGGGVVGDIAGFASATYMRGTRFLQIPTTLLAQVDASIGGKTAVNHLGIKNLIGAFHQPEATVVDTDVLSTLPEREIRCGFAEILKSAIIGDQQLFSILESLPSLSSLPDKELLEEIIIRSATVKADVVSEDEREKGRRMVLNFGHTIGHALEEMKEFNAKTHGEAIAEGIVLETRLATEMGIADADTAEAIEKLAEKITVKTDIHKDNISCIVELLFSDKKVRNRKLIFALPVRIGEVQIVDDVEPGLVRKIIEEAYN